MFELLLGGIPDHFVGVENLGLVGGSEGLGMAIAKGNNANSTVPGHEALISDFGLAQGVHGSTRGRKIPFVRQSGVAKKRCAGRKG